MAPPMATEDYYAVLEVHHTATIEVITNAYKRLAFKLHPDRNKRHDATSAFQLLGQAHETLKDVDRRRDYDLLWPSITRSKASTSNSNTSRPGAQPSTSSSVQTENNRDKARIAALEKTKAARLSKWALQKSLYESKIFELNRNIRRVEYEIKNLDEIRRAEMAEDAKKNSWNTWVMSLLYKKVEDSEEQKADKERRRQERRLEKDMKERRVDTMKRDLKKEEDSLEQLQEQIDKANNEDDAKIRDIQARIRRREDQERRERERKEWEQREKEWQERERAERLARDKREKERQEKERLERVKRERLAELKRQQQEEEENRRREEMEKFWSRLDVQQTAKRERQEADIKHREKMYRKSQNSSAPWEDPDHSVPLCVHDGWWPKVQGRVACPECGDVWNYLLQCPGCAKKACPKCQYVLRPRMKRY